MNSRGRVCFEAKWAVEQNCAVCAALFVGENMWGTKAFMTNEGKDDIIFVIQTQFICSLLHILLPTFLYTICFVFLLCFSSCSKHLRASV